MATLVIERVFDAPPELVWKAFTDPDELARWFGPVGYSVPRESVDLDMRPGGYQRLTMVADDPSYPPGGPVDAVIDEVVENRLIVGHEDLDDEMAALFGSRSMSVRIELHAENGKTRLVLTQGPYSDDFEPNAREGWLSSFSKLDTVLAR
jgi:uncharacterized protein YndB with AHSA1/START domain